MPEAIIQVRDLHKSLGGLPVLQGISLDVSVSEKVAVIGPSGSGKSTFLRCLNALEQADQGSIIVGGIQLDDVKANINRVRSEVGMVFQQFNLFPHMTALENCALSPRVVRKLPRRQAESIAREMLEKVGLSDKLKAHPGQLSGGQQQRVAIARALAMQPKIMLFDEVTSALDPELVAEVLAVIRQLVDDGMTMLIVTHEMRFAEEIGSRLLFMDEGRVLEDSIPHQVLHAPRHPRTQLFLERRL